MNHFDHKSWRFTQHGMWEALLGDAVEDSVLKEIEKELWEEMEARPSDLDEKQDPVVDADGPAEADERQMAPDSEHAADPEGLDGKDALPEDAIEASVLENLKQELQQDLDPGPSDPDVVDSASDGRDIDAVLEAPSTDVDAAQVPEITSVGTMLAQIRKELGSDTPPSEGIVDETSEPVEDSVLDEPAQAVSPDPEMPTSDQDELDPVAEQVPQDVVPDEIVQVHPDDLDNQPSDEDALNTAPDEIEQVDVDDPAPDPESGERAEESLQEETEPHLAQVPDVQSPAPDAVEDTLDDPIGDPIPEPVETELQNDFDAALEQDNETLPQGQLNDEDTPADPASEEITARTVDDQPTAKTGVTGKTIDGDMGPIKARDEKSAKQGGGGDNGSSENGGGGNNSGRKFHERLGPIDFSGSLKAGLRAVRRNMAIVMVFSTATNILVLAIPIYLFQISDRVLTSRSIDTLIMLTAVIVGAVILQVFFDAIRRFMLMRTAVEVAVQLGSPTLSAAARASLHGNGREYQILGDLQQVRGFLVSGTLISFLDGPFAPLFIVAIFLIHPDLGMIVVGTALGLLAIAIINQRLTSKPFAEANQAMSKANVHLDSMARNSQIINALAMISEAVDIWGKDTASSLKSQVRAQDWNIVTATLSRGIRLLTQVGMLGWGAYLAIQGEMTGGMVIAASIIAGRALAPIEGAISGWNQFVLSRASYERIATLLKASPLNFERLKLPDPEGRLDVERLLYVPPGTKSVILNSVHFSLLPGESLAIIGDSGAGKTTLGKMLVGSILPTSGCVRLDLMDLRNWDQRQFGENIGYLPQDVQLFPGSIKDNIGRMRSDATDAAIYEAAKLADVHEMIASMPHGYETVVTVDGSPLSGGQKQRVALARAFFGNPKLVVLDEPNSNLDALGDRALYNALDHAKKNKITMVAITQKPALLQYVDKILLLSNGTVSMFGYRNDVLRALAENQNQGRLGKAGN